MEPDKLDEAKQLEHTEAYLRNMEQNLSEADIYREMYLHLFRACVWSIEAIRDGRPWDAEHRLIEAQQETETMFVEAGAAYD